MKKKILTMCMSAALLLQMCPVAFAASEESTPITVQAIVAEKSYGDESTETRAVSKVSVEYETIAAAMDDLSDGKVTDKDGVICTLDSTEPCKIYINRREYGEEYEETISKKVIISADSVGTEVTTDVSDSEISLHFQKVEIAVDGTIHKDKNTVIFSGGLEVQNGASLVLGNNLTHKKGVSISYSFGAPVTVSGSLKFEGNYQQMGSSGGTEGSVNFDGANLTVAAGGEVTAGSVAITGSDTTSPLLVVTEGGKLDFVTAGGSSYGTIQTSGTAIQVDGGDVTIGAGKITSNNGSAVVANSGNVTVEKGGNKVVTTPEISSTGASSIAVGNGAELTVSGGNISNNDGKPAISVAENATLKIPTESTAQITTSNENGQAIDLAGGSKVQKGDTTITVGADGDSYVGNDGSIILGAGSSVTDPNGTTELPNGGSVDPDGNVEENTVSVTGVELDKTSLSLYEGDTETLTATVKPDNATNKAVTWTSSDAGVATVENGVVTAVSSGTATITVTTVDGGKTASCAVTVSRASSGSSSDHERTYVIVTEDDGNGSVTVSADEASAGTRITVTVKPDAGYVLDELTVTDAKNKDLKLTKRSETTYTFHMADSKVTVEASFTRDGEAEKPGSLFDDVSANAYYADAVKWAVEQGITSGTSATTFSPDMSCTRAQIVTFLWRANGSPKADGANPFTDVSADAYYYDAVLWAVKEGITSGTSATTFSPDATVTRGQTVTFLYRAAGAPAVTGGSFADVAADAYYADAVAWAVKEGITSGTGGNSFSPDAPCTRGQIVTFLYRDAK